MSSGDWNQEFTELVRRGVGAPEDAITAPAVSPDAGGCPAAGASPAAGESPAAAAAFDGPPAGSGEAAAARRVTIASALLRAGFIDADHATPNNPAVEVLAELLAPEADIDLCLTCHAFSATGRHAFTQRTGRFPARGSFWTDQAVAQVSGGPTLLAAPRRDLVLCTEDALCWTASRPLGDLEDSVALYSVPFRDILGATVRHRHKGIVEVWIDEGPTLSFRVEPNAADALQAQVDQAAQSQ